MNHLAQMKVVEGVEYIFCSCGWKTAGNHDATCAAFSKHVEDNTPAWHDRPTVPGLWIWHCHTLDHTIAVRLSQHDIDGWQDRGTFRVYGPIPDDSETKERTVKSGVELIREERLRQVEEEGWAPEHDDQHRHGEMAQAAACYAMPVGVRKMRQLGNLRIVPDIWPWESVWWKPTSGDRIRDLVKAGALIAAEIDRLQRQTP